MKIELTNQQSEIPIREDRILNLLEWLMPRVQALDPVRTWGELSIALLDDETIAELNATYFGRSEPTDVISFGLDPVPPDAHHAGEVLVNVPLAHSHPNPDRELAWYLAHGCHHLTGASDDTPDQRAAMHQIEHAWLDEANRAGHLEGLIGIG